MSWSSIGASIGGIIGNLIDVFAIEDGIIAYEFFKENKDINGQEPCVVSFHKEMSGNEEVYLFVNQSYDVNAAITFPAKGEDSGETVVVTGGGRLQLNKMFKNHAKFDNSSFNVSADGLQPRNTNASVTQVQSICSKYGLPVDSSSDGIGSFMSVKSDGKSLTLIPIPGISIIEIANISVSSDCDTVFDALKAGALQKDGSWLWSFPEPITSAVNVSVIANLQINNTMLKAGELTKASENDLTRLRNAKRLNW
jgi:hypothetical protein